MKKILSTTLALVKKYYFMLFCAIALAVPDLLIKELLTPGVFEQGYVSFVAGLFSACWICIITALCVCILPRRWGRVVFAILWFAFFALSFSEYIYYMIFEQFFGVKSIMLAGEGADYIDYVLQLIDVRIISYAVISLLALVVALARWRRISLPVKIRFLPLATFVVIIAATHIGMQPELHRDNLNSWDSWRNPRAVYKKFGDVNKSMEICGLYQFIIRDAYTTVFPNDDFDENTMARIDEYFVTKGQPMPNDYTGLLKGKNVIAVMMESIDTWMIDETHTPTLYNLLRNSINFKNYYAPFFGTGFTFSSEFAFNTGLFAPSSAGSASNFSTNSFPYALARLFKEAGYTTNSFHFNSAEFYNRGIMHKSFGYDKYHPLAEFGMEGTEAELDSNMIQNDALYNKMTEKIPFFNFIITYSAHLPYTGNSAKLELAKEYRQDLLDDTMHPEKNNVHILAADTDEFFRQLLLRLEQDGLLQDTVIVAFTDHFAYGVSAGMLTEWKNQDHSHRVPAFIYAPGVAPRTVDKPMMTIDWAPTLVNLFGLSTEARYVGSDIFDPSNGGFAYLETRAWMDENMYHEPTEEDELLPDAPYIQKQNQRVIDMMEVNDAVVLNDYYKKLQTLKSKTK